MQVAQFQNIADKLKELLVQANSTVDIAMAWFTNESLFQVLENCLNRGVKVRLVLLDNPINFMEYAPDFNRLIKNGGELYIASDGIGFMHHKFCIVDEKILVTGSYNWTYYAETRNIENVFLTDDASVIAAYQQEFNRLINVIDAANCVPRLTMLELESCDYVDSRELNFEIEHISRIQNRPVRRVFKTRTQVMMTEIKRSPIAKYDVGILVSGDRGNPEPSIFIKAGTKLPVSCDNTFYFDSVSEHECPCKIVRSDASNNQLVKEEDLLRIAKGVEETNLPIDFSMKLEDDGSLRVDVSCKKSGQRMTISTLDKNLVRYE